MPDPAKLPTTQALPESNSAWVRCAALHTEAFGHSSMRFPSGTHHVRARPSRPHVTNFDPSGEKASWVATWRCWMKGFPSKDQVALAKEAVPCFRDEVRQRRPGQQVGQELRVYALHLPLGLDELEQRHPVLGGPRGYHVLGQPFGTEVLLGVGPSSTGVRVLGVDLVRFLEIRDRGGPLAGIDVPLRASDQLGTARLSTAELFLDVIERSRQRCALPVHVDRLPDQSARGVEPVCRAVTVDRLQEDRLHLRGMLDPRVPIVLLPLGDQRLGRAVVLTSKHRLRRLAQERRLVDNHGRRRFWRLIDVCADISDVSRPPPPPDSVPVPPRRTRAWMSLLGSMNSCPSRPRRYSTGVAHSRVVRVSRPILSRASVTASSMGLSLAISEYNASVNTDAAPSLTGYCMATTAVTPRRTRVAAVAE